MWTSNHWFVKCNNYSRNSLSNIGYINMTRPKVLVTHSSIPEVALKLLRDECNVDIWDQDIPIPKTELLLRIKGVDALFCVITNKIDDEVLNAAGSNLKIIATMSVGVDHLDLQAIKLRNILVGHTPGVLTDAVAELTMGLLLVTARRLIEANRSIYKGEWKSWSPLWMTGSRISGSNVGIVGLGRIGLRIAEYLCSFGVNQILYTSRTEKPAATKLGAHKVNLDFLLNNSDFVIVTIALVPESREMFNKETFVKMKKSAIFINVSRGEVVHQPSLIEALKNGTIQAAGLDVMTPEPVPLDSELLKLNNCVIFPHLGSAAIKTREEMSIITAKNILAVLHSQPDEMPAILKI
ncbi:PREDICTED: glyoxylate reductase/hydroxypyruvate reductase-like [Ceratosolen solmsi marchali]|uniref:Glyoxylate reductase/hydroxypyruvate reductase n=1 Tax=Ceratosolen solmsi marchali TaxID=326594 RepID=A0AAJ7E0A7_9HYME|nr:PREDICTED: glyoxylate reductase/hydroxypyruvate reductase-like [Ceratosolen solmsi marchali]